jgi:hypothetical protein
VECPPKTDAKQRGLRDAGLDTELSGTATPGRYTAHMTKQLLQGQEREQRAVLRHPVILVVLLLAIGGCKGPTPAWNGNWKLNPARSQVESGYITIAASPGAGIRLSNDAFTFDFHCDGKEYSNPNGEALTTSCNQMNTDKWKLTYRRKGTITSEVFWDLSPDGKTLSIHGKSIRPDGSSKPVLHVYYRRDEGKGFSGRWQASNPLESDPGLLALSLAGGRLHFAYPQIGEYVDAPLDGTTVPMHTGPGARAGFAMSVKQEGRLQMHTQLSFGGQVIQEGTLKLSDDGRTVVRQLWVPARPSETDSLVYEKQ